LEFVTYKFYFLKIVSLLLTILNLRNTCHIIKNINILNYKIK